MARLDSPATMAATGLMAARVSMTLHFSPLSGLIGPLLHLRHRSSYPFAFDDHMRRGAEHDRLDQVAVDVGIEAGLLKRVGHGTGRAAADQPGFEARRRPANELVPYIEVAVTAGIRCGRVSRVAWAWMKRTVSCPTFAFRALSPAGTLAPLNTSCVGVSSA